MLCRIVKEVAGVLIRVLCWVPALFAMATFGWSYYAYVFMFCGKYVKEQALRVVFSLVYHLLLFFCLWPYAMTTFTSPAPVPESFHFSPVERQALASCSKVPALKKAVLEVMARKRGVLTRSARGLVAYCNRCQCIKPDRCHHCSNCKRCITKMDHHCPWFNNCVSFRTYKFFLLTLFYIVLLGAYSSASTSLYLRRLNRRRRLLGHSIHITFLVVVGASVVALMGAMLAMHLLFVARNRSTLEQARAPKFMVRGDSFDLGVRRNFMEVFGTNAALWTLPVHTSLGDGARFPTRLHPSGRMTPTDEPVVASSASHDVPSRTGGDKDEDGLVGERPRRDSASAAGDHALGSRGPKSSPSAPSPATRA